MSVKIQDSRQTILGHTWSGLTPSLGPTGDHTDGTWDTGDIYPGEFLFNHSTRELWIGYDNLSGNTGVTKFAAGNFMSISGGSFSGVVQFCTAGLKASVISGCSNDMSIDLGYSNPDYFLIEKGLSAGDPTFSRIQFDDFDVIGLSSVNDFGGVQMSATDSGFSNQSSINLAPGSIDFTSFTGPINFNAAAGYRFIGPDATTSSIQFWPSFGVTPLGILGYSGGSMFIDLVTTNRFNIVSSTGYITNGPHSSLGYNVYFTGNTRTDGMFATTLSGTNIFSGSSNLNAVFQPINKIPRVQNGTNTYTGGTEYLPTVNVSALTINALTVTGNTILASLTATTYYSGATSFESIFATLSNPSFSGISSFCSGLKVSTIAACSTDVEISAVNFETTLNSNTLTFSSSATTTNNATKKTIATIAVSNNDMISIEGRMIGQNTANTKFYGCKFHAAFYKTGSTMVQLATTDLQEKTNFSTATMSVEADGTAGIKVAVTGEASEGINWVTHYNWF